MSVLKKEENVNVKVYAENFCRCRESWFSEKPAEICPKCGALRVNKNRLSGQTYKP